MTKQAARILACVLLLSSLPAASRAQGEAQPGGQLATVEQRAAFRTERMKDELGLEGEQLEKVSAINLKYAKEADEIAKSGDSEEERFKKLAGMAARKDADLKAVLTPDQFLNYEAKRKKWQERAAAAAEGALDAEKTSNAEAD